MISECSLGSFGPRCAGDCSNRCTGSDCDKRDGRCNNGCSNGGKGPYCTQSKRKIKF